MHVDHIYMYIHIYIIEKVPLLVCSLCEKVRGLLEPIRQKYSELQKLMESCHYYK